MGERDRAAIFTVEVLRPPSLELDRLVVAHRIGREAVLQRGQVDDGLNAEPGCRLATTGAVELVLAVVTPADERAHGAVRRHGDERALLDAGLVAFQRKLVDQGLLGRRLHGDVDRGLDHDVWSTRPIRSLRTSITQSAT